MGLLRKDFWKVTIRQIKKNFQCARCEKENCPLRYKHDMTINGINVSCDTEKNKKMEKLLKKRMH